MGTVDYAKTLVRYHLIVLEGNDSFVYVLFLVFEEFVVLNSF